MPASARPARVLSVIAVAGVLLAGSTGCEDKDAKTPAAASVPPSASATVSPSASASPSASPAPSASPSTSASPSASRSAAPAAPSSVPPPPPPSPTRLSVSADTRGGGLALVRGGAAQEFTVTLRNGNTAEYRHLLIAFQMESLEGGPGDPPATRPGFALEHFEDSSGTWKPADLRIANDARPESLFTGGSALARDAVRVERYRLRATAGGPTGSTPLMVYFIDTDAHQSAAAHTNLPSSTS
ncbi:hypothetical protein ACFXDJ_03455 [Streptomyces sp. NPDC059443]|uniref:hypothetical protein n=1 Tax=unclassified Streptomyces TaxID=2593676 RepID=UPI0036AF4575